MFHPSRGPLFSVLSCQNPERALPYPYGGSTTEQESSISIQQLDDELSSIHTVWNQAHIVVVGHSLGGLIAEQWWRCIVGLCGVPLTHANAGDTRGCRACVLTGLTDQRLQDDDL